MGEPAAEGNLGLAPPAWVRGYPGGEGRVSVGRATIQPPRVSGMQLPEGLFTRLVPVSWDPDPCLPIATLLLPHTHAVQPTRVVSGDVWSSVPNRPGIMPRGRGGTRQDGTASRGPVQGKAPSDCWARLGPPGPTC